MKNKPVLTIPYECLAHMMQLINVSGTTPSAGVGVVMAMSKTKSRVTRLELTSQTRDNAFAHLTPDEEELVSITQGWPSEPQQDGNVNLR